jgi:hypothetical protein
LQACQEAVPLNQTPIDHQQAIQVNINGPLWALQQAGPGDFAYGAAQRGDFETTSTAVAAARNKFPDFCCNANWYDSWDHAERKPTLRFVVFWSSCKRACCKLSNSMLSM